MEAVERKEKERIPKKAMQGFCPGPSLEIIPTVGPETLIKS